MFLPKLFGRRPIERAASATIEQLEQRRLLTGCSQIAGTSVYQIVGDDNVNNVITVYWDGVNSRLYVKEGTTLVCTDTQGSTSVEVYGGSSPSATSTGADTITVDSSNGMNVTIYGQDGNDTLTGASEVDSIVGGDGADSIRGGDGNDWLHGNNGDDFVDGQGGGDNVFGEANNDTCFGGDSDDNIYGGDNNDWIGAGTSPYTNQEAGSDWLEGGANNDTVRGGNGQDTLWGDVFADGTIVGTDDIYGGTRKGVGPERGSSLLWDQKGDQKGGHPCFGTRKGVIPALDQKGGHPCFGPERGSSLLCK